VRSALSGDVPELAVITNLNGERLVSTSLTPELGGVAPDAREIAFRTHLRNIGL
jgi:hypothetical protein